MTASESYKSILEQLASIPEDKITGDAQTRKQAIALSRKLTVALEPPVNRATDLMFAPYATIAARIAIDLNLFGLLQSAGGPISTSELSKQSGGEELLIERLLRLLAALDFLREDGPDLWSATETTKAIAVPAITAGHRMIYDLTMSAAISAPKYLREVGHISPSEPADGLIQYAHHTKLPSFAYVQSKPDILSNFNNFMGHTMGERPYWYDWYPVEERLLKDFDPSRPLLIDIGGGKGHDVQAFHSKFTGRGKLILQDLPQALNSIEPDGLDPAIERSEYDFFTEQKVVGARAYFFHHILHDWSDKYCLQIFAALRGAMIPGYSKLLIHDLVLPNSKATAYQCIWDMNMMAFNGAIERSRKQWTELLDKAGFEIVNFWADDEDADGLVEAIIKA